MHGQCENNPTDKATDVCDACYGEYCDACTIELKTRKHPLCKDCAVIISGIRGKSKIPKRGERKTANARRKELKANNLDEIQPETEHEIASALKNLDLLKSKEGGKEKPSHFPLLSFINSATDKLKEIRTIEPPPAEETDPEEDESSSKFSTPAANLLGERGYINEQELSNTRQYQETGTAESKLSNVEETASWPQPTEPIDHPHKTSSSTDSKENSTFEFPRSSEAPAGLQPPTLPENGNSESESDISNQLQEPTQRVIESDNPTDDYVAPIPNKIPESDSQPSPVAPTSPMGYASQYRKASNDIAPLTMRVESTSQRASNLVSQLESQ